MASVVMVLCVIVAILVLLSYVRTVFRKRPPFFPPGASWLPFLGDLPEVKKLAKKLGGQHLAFLSLAKKHNTNVLGLKLGREYVVVVSSYPTIKQVLTSEEYDGRPNNFFLRLRTMGTRKGITSTDGEHWRIQRTFLTTHLRDLGFGRKPMDLMIKEELDEVIGILQRNECETQINQLLAPCVINVLWALTAGKRIGRDHPLLSKLLNLFAERSKVFDMAGGTLSLYPWLRFIAPDKSGYNVVRHLNSKLKTIFMNAISEHKNTWTDGRDDDFIYSFLSEMHKNSGQEDSTFTEDQLMMVCLDIFIAGSETTSNTLGFAFLIMILYPEIQRKVCECLDKNLDKDKELDYSDRHKIPYIEAVLLEVERYYEVVPITGPRRVLRDTELEGYKIPKDTTVLINMHTVYHDKEYWVDPEEFRPERFLDENSKIIYSNRLLPFGLGRRRCMGEVLARSCIFMFFAGIMRKFSVHLTNGEKKPTGRPIPGITMSPEICSVKFTPRYFH